MGLNHEDKTILWCISQLIKDVKNLAETKSNQGWFLHVNWWKRMKTWSQSELYNQESRTYKRRFCQIWNKILILNIKLSVMEYFILIIYLFTVFTNWYFFYLFFFFLFLHLAASHFPLGRSCCDKNQIVTNSLRMNHIISDCDSDENFAATVLEHAPWHWRHHCGKWLQYSRRVHAEFITLKITIE